MYIFLDNVHNPGSAYISLPGEKSSPMTDKPKYPNLDILHDERGHIEDLRLFLAWLAAQGYRFGRWGECSETMLDYTPVPPLDLICAYLGVDQREADREREAMLREFIANRPTEPSDGA